MIKFGEFEIYPELTLVEAKEEKDFDCFIEKVNHQIEGKILWVTGEDEMKKKQTNGIDFLQSNRLSSLLRVPDTVNVIEKINNKMKEEKYSSLIIERMDLITCCKPEDDTLITNFIFDIIRNHSMNAFVQYHTRNDFLMYISSYMLSLENRKATIIKNRYGAIGNSFTY